MGGAKVGDKLPVIENLLTKVDTLIIGGGMAYTFFKAMGYEIGQSILDEANIELAKELMAKAEQAGVKMLLPVDAVCADSFADEAAYDVYPRENMSADRQGLGHRTCFRRAFQSRAFKGSDNRMERPYGRV